MIGGAEYEIKSDFRTSINFESLVTNPDADKEQTALEVLELYYPVLPDDIGEAFEKIIWFHGCGKPERTGTGKKQPRAYDFSYDFDYIYAAFKSQYQIDLHDVEYLHWWKFKAMFDALTEECVICKIMGYRCMDLSGMSSEEKQHFKKMKKLYKLPDMVSVDDQLRNERIVNALLHGGNVSDVLKG